MDIIKFNGWELLQREGDGVLTVADLFLAEKLEYSRPVEIRKLIRRMEKAGQLGVVATVATTSGNKGGRGGVQYLLTKHQAIKVTTRAETKVADKITDDVITVFLAAQEGRLTAPATPLLSALEQQVKQLADVVGVLVSIEHARLTREQANAREESTPVDFPTGPARLPSPSKAKANQGELIPLQRPWYLVADICQRWDIDYPDFWREFGRAGGRRKDQARQSNRGWQVREDIARKILVQLDYARGHQ